MLDIKFIRDNKELVEKNCKNRGVKADIGRLLELDAERRERIVKIEELRALRNQKSKGKPSPEEIENMRTVGDRIAASETDLAALETEYLRFLKTIPNMTHPESPVGGEDDFKVLEVVGAPPKFDFEPKDHEALMLDLNVIDFDRATKTTGAKFYFAKNDLVRLNQALLNYGLDIAVKHGFTLMETPDLAKDEILEGIGFNPRGPETQVYSIEGHDLSLVGTAEITLGGYHAKEILDLNTPVKFAGISHCFRTEAGAYGRESRGLYRVHQFTKLELFAFCRPDDSEELHREILHLEKEIIDGLGLPYRIIDIASADLSGPAYRKFDIEAWMTMKNGYGEVTSASNCTDYQARRLAVRTKDREGNTVFAHTLNGTALNTSRFPIAIFENFQREDGSIEIPKALRPYMSGQKYIEKI
ncbi:MAG TPA: serine--tRNA ligase [Candidatus Paceibacterota bacterium]|nr:serine--tRNA ligase [Candidatus Paceibacterota bacterium]